MEYVLRFAHTAVLYWLLPAIAILAWLRWRYYNGVRYRYSLTSTIKLNNFATRSFARPILFLMRFIVLLILAFLIAKPRFVDLRSHVPLEGIDIMMVLDVSGSMSFPHHGDDNRPRIEVAKEEAIRFVDKRSNDALGLVIFGNDALSRCPLTADKALIKEAIGELQLGIIDHSGTLLARGLLTAINRLRHSTAKSKVIILLTDGAPSEHDIDPQIALKAAQQLGIKIYTIGIGSDMPIYVPMPPFGMQRIEASLNKELLETIAKQTGGQFFEAKQAQDMRAIYDTIDRLERTKIQAPLFSNYRDWFMPLLIAAIAIIVGELLLKSSIWFGL